MPDSDSKPSPALIAEQQQQQQQQPTRSELDALHILDPSNNPSLEQQLDNMSEVEQKRLLEKLTIQTEADIRTFSMFLKLPTVILLMLTLVFAYNYATSGFRSSTTLPFTSVRVRTERPMVSAEISVVVLQFTLYLLSSGRWNWFTKGGVVGLGLVGFGYPLACSLGNVVELVWWVLPALNLAVVSYAQLNMRRSRQDIEKLAARTNHYKND